MPYTDILGSDDAELSYILFATQEDLLTQTLTSEIILTQSVSVELLHLFPESHITLTQSCSRQATFNRTPVNSVSLSHNVVHTLNAARSASSSITLDHEATYVKWKLRTASNSFTPSNSCNLIHAINVISSISLSQSCNRGIDYSRVVTTTIIYPASRTYYLNYGTPITVGNTQVAKIDPRGFVGNRRIPPPVHSTTGLTTRDNYDAGSNGYLTISTSKYSITLKTPILGDTDGLKHSLIIHKSVNNVLYTYKKTQRTRKLEYTFNIDSVKFKELRLFIMGISQYNEPLQISNWKGEFWLCKFINESFIGTRKSRWENSEQTSITLQFEGLKLN